MKKLLISLAVTSALGLTGCGGDKLEDIKTDAVADGQVLPLSRVVFDPTASKYQYQTTCCSLAQPTAP